jgi:hypothetical protein
MMALTGSKHVEILRIFSILLQFCARVGVYLQNMNLIFVSLQALLICLLVLCDIRNRTNQFSFSDVCNFKKNADERQTLRLVKKCNGKINEFLCGQIKVQYSWYK